MPAVTCCDNCVRLLVLVGRDLKSVMRYKNATHSVLIRQELMQIFH